MGGEKEGDERRRGKTGRREEAREAVGRRGAREEQENEQTEDRVVGTLCADLG